MFLKLLSYCFALQKRHFHQFKTMFSLAQNYVFIDQKHSFGSHVSGGRLPEGAWIQAQRSSNSVFIV